MGFTPTLSAGVWVGFDDNSPLGLTGGATAAPIWGEFMKCSEPYFAEAGFIAPRGVTYATIDLQSGGLATENCPSSAVAPEVFVSGTEPRRPCSTHGDGGSSDEGGSDLYQAQQQNPNGGGFWGRMFGR